MRIRVIIPLLGGESNPDFTPEEVIKDVSRFKAPDTEIDALNIPKGPASIESRYDEVLAVANLLDMVKQAEEDGCDGVYIHCFGDPGVHEARELVSIPVVGGFQPAALTASLISSKWSIVTILRNVIPMIADLARSLGIESNIASVRHINMPVLELTDKKVLKDRLLLQMEKAVDEDGAEAIVLGCTGMMGLAQDLAEAMAARGRPVPVVDPTASAIGYLELLIRNGISHSPLTYPTPPEKERRV